MRSHPSSDSASADQNAAPQATAQNASASADQAAAPTLVDQAVERGKQWINDSGIGDKVNQLPQQARDLGNKAKEGFGSLSTTQKIVGGAILAAGIGWLASRGRSASKAEKSPSRYAGPGYARQADSDSRFGSSRFDSGTSFSPSSTSYVSPSSSVDREIHYPGGSGSGAGGSYSGDL